MSRIFQIFYLLCFLGVLEANHQYQSEWDIFACSARGSGFTANTNGWNNFDPAPSGSCQFSIAGGFCITNQNLMGAPSLWAGMTVNGAGVGVGLDLSNSNVVMTSIQGSTATGLAPCVTGPRWYNGEGSHLTRLVLSRNSIGGSLENLRPVLAAETALQILQLDNNQLNLNGIDPNFWSSAVNLLNLRPSLTYLTLGNNNFPCYQIPEWCNRGRFAPEPPTNCGLGCIDDKEGEALVALYKATAGTSWFRKNSWAQIGVDKCSYEGVSCAGAAVTRVSLRANHLEGTLPSEIGYLTNLRDLDLGENILAGPIAPEIMKISSLTALNLRATGLSAPLPWIYQPSWWFSGANQVWIAENTYMCGELPPFCKLGKYRNITGNCEFRCIDLDQTLTQRNSHSTKYCFLDSARRLFIEWWVDSISGIYPRFQLLKAVAYSAPLSPGMKQIGIGHGWKLTNKRWHHLNLVIGESWHANFVPASYFFWHNNFENTYTSHDFIIVPGNVASSQGPWKEVDLVYSSQQAVNASSKQFVTLMPMECPVTVAAPTPVAEAVALREPTCESAGNLWSSTLAFMLAQYSTTGAAPALSTGLHIWEMKGGPLAIPGGWAGSSIDLRFELGTATLKVWSSPNGELAYPTTMQTCIRTNDNRGLGMTWEDRSTNRLLILCQDPTIPAAYAATSGVYLWRFDLYKRTLEPWMQLPLDNTLTTSNLVKIRNWMYITWYPSAPGSATAGVVRIYNINQRLLPLASKTIITINQDGSITGVAGATPYPSTANRFISGILLSMPTNACSVGNGRGCNAKAGTILWDPILKKNIGFYVFTNVLSDAQRGNGRYGNVAGALEYALCPWGFGIDLDSGLPNGIFRDFGCFGQGQGSQFVPAAAINGNTGFGNTAPMGAEIRNINWNTPSANSGLSSCTATLIVNLRWATTGMVAFPLLNPGGYPLFTGGEAYALYYFTPTDRVAPTFYAGLGGVLPPAGGTLFAGANSLITLNPGPYGGTDNAIHFDYQGGTQNYLSLANVFAGPDLPSSGTISMYVKFGRWTYFGGCGNAYCTSFHCFGGTIPGAVFYLSTPDITVAQFRVQKGTGVGGFLQSNTFVGVNTWNHIAYTWTTNYHRLVVNGIDWTEGASITTAGANLDGTAHLGGCGTIGFANVVIDEYAYYASYQGGADNRPLANFAGYTASLVPNEDILFNFPVTVNDPIKPNGYIFTAQATA